MTSLHGLRVLITRSAHQGKELVTQTQNYGGLAIHFPTLEIIRTKNIKKVELRIKKLKEYDFVIFISPNSVFNTAETIHGIWPAWPKNTKTFATGPGTTLALKQHNLPCDNCPEKDFSGTGLLNLTALQNIKQKKILIIKGEDGRLYLAKGLKARGAQVNNLNVYKRRLPKIDKNNIPHHEAIDVIICTSSTGLKNLVGLLYPYWQDILFKKQLLVISPRLVDIAKKLGFVKPPLISDNATNAAILKTLFSWRERSLWNHSPHPT
ncbi:uroporphyrinogen-III synthase [Rickettsiella endosymbiont of Miltochrista miniata]|uniref:uroporphyrinogen-III synthase n=1 Tax=Rickettsiella endosymbiont of Miltochrista miniata TaxID=3066239 RepID=UPI00313B3DFB